MIDSNRFNAMVSFLDLNLLNVAYLKGRTIRTITILLYINDLPNATKKLKLLLFADDTNALCSHDSWIELQDMVNTELKDISEWFKTNRLSLNIKISCYIFFT